MTFLPHRLSMVFLLTLVLIDLPVIVAVAVVGWFYGYVHTYEAVSAWRLDHPWSFVPSLLLLAALIVRWRKA